jgi:hypothetical protein
MLRIGMERITIGFFKNFKPSNPFPSSPIIEIPMKSITLSFFIVLISVHLVSGQKKDTVPTMVPKRITQKAPDIIVTKVEGESDEAGSTKKDSISWGFQAGFQITNVLGGNKGSFQDLSFLKKNKTGYNFGGYVNIPLVKGTLFLQPELNYSEKGFNATGSNVSNTNINTQTTVKFKRTYEFLELPVLIKYYAGKSLFFTAGPQVSYLFLVNDQYSSPTSPTAYDVYTRELTKLRPIVPGINFGMGFKVGETLNFSATYAFDMVTNYSFIGGDAPKFRNENFTLRFGYRLSKNSKHKN